MPYKNLACLKSPLDWDIKGPPESPWHESLPEKHWKSGRVFHSRLFCLFPEHEIFFLSIVAWNFGPFLVPFLSMKKWQSNNKPYPVLHQRKLASLHSVSRKSGTFARTPVPNWPPVSEGAPSALHWFGARPESAGRCWCAPNLQRLTCRQVRALRPPNLNKLE